MTNLSAQAAKHMEPAAQKMSQCNHSTGQVEGSTHLIYCRTCLSLLSMKPPE